MADLLPLRSVRSARAARLLFGVCALLCSGAALLSAPGKADRRPEFSAEVRRTSHGIPHIKADDEKGLGFGLGYAFAQDNLCVLADVVVTVNGERSRFFGADATYDRSGEGDQQTNLSSDFYYKYLNDPELVQASWRRQPREERDLMLGYAAGYNRYLREKGVSQLPRPCRNQQWVRELSALDILRLLRRYAVEGSGARLIDALFAAQPPSSPARSDSTPQSKLAYAPPGSKFWKQLRPRMGSNGAAFGRLATKSGKGLLLANPHFPWSSTFRFYQMHLTIPGKVDVMGASLTGFPAVNIGFNQHLAWTHTVNTSAHFTVSFLQLDPTDPTRFMVDGQSRAMTTKQLRVEVAASPQAPAHTITRTFYFSDGAPLLVLPGALEWTEASAFALRDANFENDRMLQQWWSMNKASSLAQLGAAVDSVLGVPWVNTLASDRQGNVYYADVTPVPHVSAAKQQTCIAPPFQPLMANGLFVLDGSRSACAWEVDPLAPQKGLFPAQSLPHMVRQDYVQNSNDSAWLTNAEQPLVGFPAIVSAEQTELSGRTRIGLSQIAERLAGEDGLPGRKFDLRTLQQVAFSNRAYYASMLLDDLKRICVATDEPLAKACKVLGRWDGKAELHSVGWPLFLAWREQLATTGLDYWSVPFDAADPVHTPRGLRISDPAVRAAARDALVRAVDALDQQGLDYTRTWGELQVAVRGSRRIPVHGGGGDEIYNAMHSRPTGDGQLDVYHGSAAVWTVSYETASPKVEGFLTYSQSSDPGSPYYADQTERFSKKAWINFPFSDAEIARDRALSKQCISQ